MERLDFIIPDFTRLSWVSDRAQAVWEPRFNKIKEAWSKIEWLSVVCGLRSCCITIASPKNFLNRAEEWIKHGLTALPLDIQGLSHFPYYSYSSTTVEADTGKPFLFRFVLGTSQNVLDFKRIFDAGNDRMMGKLLGFPSCCSDFFEQTWVEQGLIDTTWAMAIATATPHAEVKTIELIGDSHANILWRWMGIRAVTHLPCRFDCQPTVELGKKLIEVGREAGYDTEMNWLLEILNWPVEWSALHGIAEIKTPILKVSTRTDATPTKYAVRYKGKAFPLEGSQGLNFPYCKPH